jgi:hypothetical protein
MSDDASLLTNAAALLERYRDDERQLAIELAIIQARLEHVREGIEALAGKPRTRRGRPPKLVEDAIEMPTRITGGAYVEPETAA